MRWAIDMKRLFDVLVSGGMLVALSPILVLVSILLRCTIGSPVLFRQARPGLDGEPFEMLKFRTMTDARGEDGDLLSDSVRLTGIGTFLRRTSLDELPELWNVLKGDMSLVGPRPLLLRYMPYFTEAEMRRHSVRPGITGLAQVKGRNLLGWDERLALDVEYVDRQSIWLDLSIIWWTVGKVLKRADIAVDPSASMLDLDEERRRAAGTSDS